MADQAVAYALTTVARVKARLGITDTGFDTVLISYVNAVTAFIETRTNRRFKQATYTQELHHLDGDRRVIALKNAPVASVSAFQYRGGTPGTPAWADFSVEDYELLEDGKTGLIQLYISPGSNTVRATYSAGYLIDFSNYGNEASHTLPYDITELAERLITKRFKKRDDEGKTSVAFGGSTTTWEKLLDPDDEELLGRYSRGADVQFV